jgi:hypothetical protein
MAKKKNVMDALPNRKYVTVTWAAATTTAVYTQFDTMMGAREGAGWLVSRVDVMFGGAVPPSFSSLVVTSLRFQVLTGAQTVTLAPDDDEVVATIDYISQGQTSGLTNVIFPLSWAGPILIASRELTCAMDGSIDIAPWQSVDMLFTIWYQWVKLGSREWVEIAEARGIA